MHSNTSQYDSIECIKTEATNSTSTNFKELSLSKDHPPQIDSTKYPRKGGGMKTPNQQDQLDQKTPS